MSAQKQFLTTDQDGIEQYRISNVSEIKSPSFMPELASSEDLESLILNQGALEDNSPLLVHGYRWEQIHTQPRFSQYGSRKKSLLQHPLIFYEPPELFRYSMPDRLVTYALQGSRTRRRDFNEKLRAGNVDGAIDSLPKFFQPFLDRQRSSLVRTDEEAPDPSSVQDNGTVHDGWGDPRSDRGFQSYYRELVSGAKKAPNAHVVAPVPIILKSSGNTDIRRMRGSNQALLDMCEAANFGFGNPVHAYYHVYMDYNILRSGSNAAQEIIDALQSDLPNNDYAGVVLTITGYDRAWENNVQGALREMVEYVSQIAKQYHIPLILPRSNWYGAQLTDIGAHSFSSLMNGNSRLKAKGGAVSKDNRHYLYGKTAIYSHATNLTLDQLEKHLQNNGGNVTKIKNLPSQPPIYNPRGGSWDQKFGSPRDFRINFGKPRRLIHVEEAKEFRDGRRRGTSDPAKHYLRRSSHPHLS